MSTPIQCELFSPTIEQQFRAWVHTDKGREVANRFIRIAWSACSRGLRVGSKAIWERLRWHYGLVSRDVEEYKLDNRYTAYMARFAMDREPRLDGYFETRCLRNGAPQPRRRAILVEIKETHEQA
jgi:hypothetical protein